MTDKDSSEFREFDVMIKQKNGSLTKICFKSADVSIGTEQVLTFVRSRFSELFHDSHVTIAEVRSGISTPKWQTYYRLGQADDGGLPELKYSFSRPANKITLPPGAFLHRIAEFFCSSKTLKCVVNPILSDMQFEYCEALVAGRKFKAAWIRIRGYWAFWKSVTLFSAVKTVAEIWRKVSPN